MSETKWTPGPWEADSGDTPLMTVCLVGDVAVGAYEVTSQNIDDAHLIAAAPELYEALKEMLAECEDDEFAPHVMDAKAALAKARGES